LASFTLQERLLPAANGRAAETWNRINDEPSTSYSLENRHWVLGRNHDRIYHYAYFDPVASVFSRLTVYDLDPAAWTLRRHIFAEKASLDDQGFTLNDSCASPAEGEGRFEPGSWRLRKRRKAYFLKKPGAGPHDLRSSGLHPGGREMGFATSRLRVDLGFKLTFPLVCLIMTLIGVPFAFSMGKRGTLVGIGLSLVIAMVYWGAIAAFRSLGFAGFLSPFLAAWGPNLTFGLAGLALLFRLRT
jgi:lipopolysaccharide export LptBFGC system permease protein LptF